MVKIQASARLRGSIEVPPDKSLTHRALFLSALAEGHSTIANPLQAEDCLSTAKCMQDLGCEIDRSSSVWTVKGVGLWGFHPPKRFLDCGNSGTTMRLISGILSAQDFSTTLIGDDSLSSRPMSRVADPLRSMGARIELTGEKFAPIKIHGTPSLKPIHWKSSVASAQVKSCVLFAGLHTKGTTTFSEPVMSRDHTERMLKSCGAMIQKNGSQVSVQGPSKLTAQNWVIPGDISSAAFFLVASALVRDSDVILKNVILNPTRTGLIDVLKMAGVVLKIENIRDVGGNLWEIFVWCPIQR